MTRSLDILRRQAKQLKRAYAEGATEAVARVRQVLPDVTALRHAQALHVIAREQGHPSWPRLKLAAEMAAMDRDARAERLKTALFLGQNWVVEDLLRADPSLGRYDLALCCALYDLEGVKAALERDPSAATRLIGRRTPILHLAFSRRLQAAPQGAEDMIAIAELLVAAGADVNDGFPSEPGAEHKLSALYGAVGHAGNMRLAEWLLERGANPDDQESLYHATELGHLEGLRLLMRRNVRTSGTNALPRMLDFDNLEGARLLLEYGADPNEAVLGHPSGQPVDSIPALHQAARRGRDGRFARLLLAHGADPQAVWNGHSAYALARIYGSTSFAVALEEAGAATALSASEAALAACAQGAPPPGRPLATPSLTDEERRVLTRMIIWKDRLAHAKALVAAGLDPNQTEEMGMPPLHAAGWAGLTEQVAWLLTLSPDLEHKNAYGGDALGTILHGAMHCPEAGERDHVGCARLALEAGAKLRRAELEAVMDEDLAGFLQDWVEAHPDAILEDGAG